MNVAFPIQLIGPDDDAYSKARSALANGERLGDRHADLLAYLYSTLGAEMAIEFDSIKIEST